MAAHGISFTFLLVILLYNVSTFIVITIEFYGTGKMLDFADKVVDVFNV